MSQGSTSPPTVGSYTQGDGYNTQADSYKSLDENANPLRRVSTTSSVDDSPHQEAQGKKKRLSFGGGNDGRGGPMFKNLETIRGHHASEGYNDQKPMDGFIGAAFKRFVSPKHSSTVAGGKV